MKFMHVADLHLDRAFEGVDSAKDEQLAGRLQEAKQVVLTRIIDKALGAKVEFLLVAGDTFHQSVVTAAHQQLWQRQLERLAKAKIPVFWQFGNHDYYQQDRYWFRFPENVQTFGGEAVETLFFTSSQGERVAISSFSYEQPRITTHKATEFPARLPDVTYQIGMYHGQLGGENAYAPFTTGELASLGYDYWALGHIHVPTIVSQDPPMVYPGTPEGHSRKETDTKGVLLVEMTPGKTSFHWEEVATVTWQTIRYTVDAAESADYRVERLEESLLGTREADKLQLTHLILEVADAEAQSVVEKMMAGEVLEWLQTTLWQNSQHSVWLNRWEIQQREAEESGAPHFFADGAHALLEEVAKHYVEEEAMLQLLEPIERIAALHRTFPQTREERQALIARALDLVEERKGTR